ncbi:MAG: cyclic nucleotide-binding domain-containing protein [Thermodesulfovibrionales bacterium]|nr:cyclic nucleotide-binding domain-containing protein [Thermodesulfovibrionales bacterium]
MIQADLLKQQVLLSDIDSEGLEKLSRIIKKVPLKKGEYLFKEKDETGGVYLLHSGKIEISRVTADGWRQTLAVVTPGDFFGELSILERRKHVASAIAVEDVELFLIPKKDFERLMEEDVKLACYIIRKIAIEMSKKLRRTTDKFLSALISY